MNSNDMVSKVNVKANKELIASNIRMLLEAKGWKEGYFAEKKLGMNPTTFSNKMNPKMPNRCFDYFEMLIVAEAFQMTPDEIFFTKLVPQSGKCA